MSWPMVKLGDVATLINGRAYKQHEMLDKGKYPLMRVGNFFSNREWYYSDLELPERQYCDKGDLLYAWSASFGPKIWDGGKVIYHYHIWKVDLNEKLIDKKYLYYALQRDVEFIKREQGSGSTMVHVTKSAMENRHIPLPPLAEQKRIAAILDKADAIRRKRQQAIQLADDFLRAVFLEMFGDPVTNPKGWVRKSIETVAPVLPLKKKVAEHENVWLLNLDAIEAQSGKIIHKLIVPYAEVGSSTNHFNETHVLYSKLRPYLNKVVIPNSEGMATSELLTLLPSPKKITREFLATYLRSNGFVSWANTKVAGAKMPRLSTVELKKHQIFVPPLQLQQEFSQKFRHVLDMAERSNEVLKNNDSFFSCLSQKAFSGQL